jgi:hypothetical protein
VGLSGVEHGGVRHSTSTRSVADFRRSDKRYEIWGDSALVYGGRFLLNALVLLLRDRESEVPRKLQQLS